MSLKGIFTSVITLLSLNLAVQAEAGRGEENKAPTGTRLLRSSQAFQNQASGLSGRWWRNLRSPSFCKMILCNGSCADRSNSCCSSATPCGLAVSVIPGSPECNSGCCP